MTLDGLLAGVLYAKYRDPDRAIADVPLAKWKSIPNGSIILLDEIDIPRVSEIKIINQIARTIMMDTDLASRVTKIPVTLSLTNGDYYPLLSRYPTISPRVVRFLGRGDIEAVRDIIGNIRFIGKLRTRGLGQVALNGIVIDEVDGDDPLFGIAVGGQLLRPVPTRLRNLLPSNMRPMTVQDQTWCLPYLEQHGGIREPCLVPPLFMGEPFELARFKEMGIRLVELEDA